MVSYKVVLNRPIRAAARGIMTTFTIANLPRLSAKNLSKVILEESEASDRSFAVVDVRDDDYIGGHIRGSTNVPSRHLDVMMPSLVRQFREKKMVIFHCALSQQRGPSAALKYIREREKSLGQVTHAAGEELAQTVYVLDKGFVGWQELYGEDERLTEAYRKELWLTY